MIINTFGFLVIICLLFICYGLFKVSKLMDGIKARLFNIEHNLDYIHKYFENNMVGRGESVREKNV